MATSPTPAQPSDSLTVDQALRLMDYRPTVERAAAATALAAIVLAHRQWSDLISSSKSMLEHGSDELQRELAATEINFRALTQLYSDFTNGDRK